MRTSSEAIAWGRRQISQPSKNWYRLCLNFVMTALDARPSGSPDADTAWNKTPASHKRRDTNPPPGVPVYWETSGKADHVALSTGNGRVLSNDIRRRGKIDEVPISEITRKWNAQYLGWTTTYVGQPLNLSAPPADPNEFPGTDAFKLGQSHPAVVTLDKRLIAHGFDKHSSGAKYTPGPTFTKWTRANVRDFQRAQGWTGSDADGYPGPSTWARLMEKPKSKPKPKPDPKPGVSTVIEKGKTPHVVTSLGSVRTHTRRVAEEITQLFQPIYFVWGIGPTGEHAQGRALDFMNYELGGGVNSPGPIRLAFGQKIADYLWANRKRLGVWYVIYNGKIISTTYPNSGWRTYTGSNPHRDHVHVSFASNPPAYKPPATPEPPKEWDELASKKDIKDAYREVLREELNRIVEAIWSAPAEHTGFKRRWQMRRWILEAYGEARKAKTAAVRNRDEEAK